MSWVLRIAFTIVFFTGLAIFAAEVEVQFNSSFDDSPQTALAFIPDNLPENEKRPLLVIAHPMGGNRYTGQKSGYHAEAAKRNWLVITPQLHGKNTPGETSCAALEAQHDIIDAVNYMKLNYPVDDSRIYLVGRSMGGMMTRIMMAKYPDVFAAGVAGQSADASHPDKLNNWVRSTLEQECGDDPWEYARRSAVNFARNLAYVPLIMWHGTNDGLVSPEFSQELYEAVKVYEPRIMPVFYLVGNTHLTPNVSPEWECTQLEPYQLTSDSFYQQPIRFYPALNLVTDESKTIFYFDLQMTENDEFAYIESSLAPADGEFDSAPSFSGSNQQSKADVIMTLKTRNLKEITINMDLIPEALRPASFILDALDAPPCLKIKQNNTISEAENVAIAD